jgi:hypothetical protein
VTLTLLLDGDVAAALAAEAERRGQTADELAAALLAAQLPKPASVHRRLNFAAVGESTSGRGAAETERCWPKGSGATRCSSSILALSLRQPIVPTRVIAVAERRGTSRIATLNRRHFAVVRPRHADAFELLP